jgi:peptide/nickel transport system substrate-binding protein
MHNRSRSLCLPAILLLMLCAALTACSSKPDPRTVTMLIENSPTSLDPRIGIDA